MCRLAPSRTACKRNPAWMTLFGLAQQTLLRHVARQRLLSAAAINTHTQHTCTTHVHRFCCMHVVRHSFKQHNCTSLNGIPCTINKHSNKLWIWFFFLIYSHILAYARINSFRGSVFCFSSCILSFLLRLYEISDNCIYITHWPLAAHERRVHSYFVSSICTF